MTEKIRFEIKFVGITGDQRVFVEAESYKKAEAKEP